MWNMGGLQWEEVQFVSKKKLAKKIESHIPKAILKEAD